LEHIYDIEAFVGKLSGLSRGSLRGVFGSGANAGNPRIRRKLMRHQVEAEFTDREVGWGHKQRDTVRSYLEVRREMISEFAPSLPAQDVDHVARQTRGLMVHDIQRQVEEFLSSGSLSCCPTHPTNTCDPVTGNWAEQLLDLDRLEGLLGDEHFAVRMVCGYYTHSPALPKRAVKFVLNALISHLGSAGLVLAPYYAVCADQRPA